MSDIAAKDEAQGLEQAAHLAKAAKERAELEAWELATGLRVQSSVVILRGIHKRRSGRVMPFGQNKTNEVLVGLDDSKGQALHRFPLGAVLITRPPPEPAVRVRDASTLDELFAQAGRAITSDVDFTRITER